MNATNPHAAASPIARVDLPTPALTVLLHLEVDGPQSVGELAARTGYREGVVMSWCYFLCDHDHACLRERDRQWMALTEDVAA